jgi:hypothetical protein
MNVTEARKFLKSFGWFTYARTGGWVVYDPGGYNGFCTDRELIHLARSRRSPNWRPFDHPKSAVGCGGKWCTCCTKAPPAEMKKWERKAARRKGKRISPFDDSMEYHESFA